MYTWDAWCWRTPAPHWYPPDAFVQPTDIIHAYLVEETPVSLPRSYSRQPVAPHFCFSFYRPTAAAVGSSLYRPPSFRRSIRLAASTLSPPSLRALHSRCPLRPTNVHKYHAQAQYVSWFVALFRQKQMFRIPSFFFSFFFLDIPIIILVSFLKQYHSSHRLSLYLPLTYFQF